MKVLLLPRVEHIFIDIVLDLDLLHENQVIVTLHMKSRIYFCSFRLCNLLLLLKYFQLSPNKERYKIFFYLFRIFRN